MTRSYEHIETELREHVLWIWLNRPEASNAYSSSMVEDLPRVFDEASANKAVRVVVLGARGKNFCAGGDIKAMQAQEGMFAGGANELRERYVQGIQQIPLAIMRLHKPLIAMIQGAAVGAGCDLAAMADLRLASPEAKFSETFSKVGLVPGDGGAWFLIRAVGYSRAMEMFLTAKNYSAEKALEMGLVHEVVSDQLVRRADELARSLANVPPIALQLTKKSLLQAYESSLAHHLDTVAAFQAITQRSSDHRLALDHLMTGTQGNYRHE